MSSLFGFSSPPDPVAATASNITKLEATFSSIISVAGVQVPMILNTDISFDKFLGRGTSFEVNREIFRSRFDNSSPHYVAVKHVVQTSDTDMQRRRNDSVTRELRTLTLPALRGSPNILPLVGYGWNEAEPDRRPFIVVEYSDHGTLVDYLTRPGVIVTLHERRELALDVARGLQALHDNKIIHGDLKPDNILVFDATYGDRPQLAKLADFGGSLFEDGNSELAYGGTRLYNAPEQRGIYKDGDNEKYDQDVRYFYLADMWSFGLTLWEIMRKGQRYIEQTWLAPEQAKLDFLSSVALSERDGILHRAKKSCEKLLETLVDVQSSVLHTLDLTLRDNPDQRCNVSQAIEALSQGASKIRSVSGYPGVKHLPLSSEALSSTTNRQVRSWDLDPTSRRHTSTNRRVEPDTGLILYHAPPKNLQKLQEHIEAAGIFGSLMMLKTRWDIQCQVFKDLAKSISTNSSRPRTSKYYSDCLRVALSYKVGFGVKPDNASVIRYMGMSAEGNDVAKALYYRIASSIEDQSTNPLVNGPLYTIMDENLSKHEDEESYFKTRIIMYQQKWTSRTYYTPEISGDDISKSLSLACRTGDAKKAIELCQQCSSFVLDPSQPTPVHWLIMFNDREAEELSSALIGKSEKDHGPCRGCLDICPPSTLQDSLLPEHCLTLGGSPLHWAVQARNSSLVRILIRLGANMNTYWAVSTRTTADGQSPEMSPLDVAVELHLPEIVKILLDSGAEVSRTLDTLFRCSIHCIGLTSVPFARHVIHGTNYRAALRETINILTGKSKVDIDQETSEGETPLSIALQSPDVEEYIIDELLVAGSRTTHLGVDGKLNAALITARSSVARRHNIAILRRVAPLVGSHINDLDKFGYCALHYAAGVAGGGEAVDIICQNKHCDINTRSSNGVHAIYYAAIFNSVEAMQVLLFRNVDINTATYRDNRAYCALMVAAGRKHKAMADYLLDEGANPDFSFFNSPMYQTILEAACANTTSRNSILKYLLDKHPNLRKKTLLNTADKSGRTALHKAAYEGDVEAVESLLEYGANRAPRDTVGRTPLDLVTYLLENGIRGDEIFAPHHPRVLERGEQALADFKAALEIIKDLLS
ncbi:ankyrin [Annulohypoxylon bovei var. microspora]|nr:ankyrin [Annulohypoxylon bovei var. microspora]